MNKAINFCLFFSCIGITSGINIPDANVKNFAGFRVFHPAFPSYITESISKDDAENIMKVKSLLKSSTVKSDYSGLPWKEFPEIGVSDQQNLWSKSQILDAFERHRYQGHLVWAHKIKLPEKNCILLNHWSQKAILITDYDVTKGAKGYVCNQSGALPTFISWPPMALEYEMTEKISRWQAVRVSENISSGQIFRILPQSMTKAPWELVFLLLVSKNSNYNVVQALFDTGLCPKQGLIAYIRLLEQVQQRTESWDQIPDYRKITEFQINS